MLVLFAISLVSPSPAAALPAAEDHELGDAAVLDRVILSVIENYYDPSRINSKKMFISTMEILQKAIAELKVVIDEEKHLCSIELLGAKHTLDLSELKSPWSLSTHLRKAMRFIASKLPKKEYDFMELEYAAANAMLSALDPHSNALPPDIYEYLRMDTVGEFGGLGIKITTDRRPPCHGNLTVVEVFDGTPADHAGLKVGDQIMRIDDESTVNITTSEAADRLRGKPGTRVKVQIKRTNNTLVSLNIERATIPIRSVEHEMLSGKVGYLRLLAFQENSAAEITQALLEMHEKKMKGLILDLRSNPGGLLHIAIAIADSFLPSGTIVTTAGRRAEDRSVENATADNTEPMYPMVVLINSNSASAAEILAGALRNHGRALLIGETTFGKGSVQMVQQIPGGGAIKLTSAQYLTPGDISIQAVGVQPDVTFLPVSVDSDAIDLVPSETRFSEADLDHHLDRPNVRSRTDRDRAVKATLFIPRQELAQDRARYKQCYVDEETDFSYKGRYESDFSRRLIAEAEEGSTAEELLLHAKGLIEADAKAQGKAIEKALKKMKVDWTVPGDLETAAGEKKTSPRISATAQLIGRLAPGSACKLRVTVKNGTKQPLYRLRAVTESDNYLFDGLELVFGKVPPGKSRTWTDTVEIPITARPRVDDVTVGFDALTGLVPKPAKLEAKILERAEPRLLYNWQFIDLDNGNGQFEPGEELTMHITIKNVGKGSTADAEAGLSAKPGIDLIYGRFNIGALGPGETADGVLRMRIAENFPLSEAELSLSIREWIELEGGIPTTRDLMSRDIIIPVSNEKRAVGQTAGTVTVKSGGPVLLRERPVKDGHAVATVENGAVFTTDGATESFYRVRIDKDHHAWLSTTDVVPGGKGGHKVTPVFIEPPKIQIKGSLVKRTKKNTFLLKGRAMHPVNVRDVVIFRGEQKILYLPSRTTADHIDFSAEIPLEDGANNILVVARHNDKVMGSESVFIRSDQSK